MAVIEFFLFWAIVWFLIIEGVHVLVFGWFIDEEQLDAYLGKYLEDAELNPFSKGGTLFSGLPRYVSRHRTLLTKWHIDEYGTVPRWSKWTKRLDDKRSELLKERRVTKLSDY